MTGPELFRRHPSNPILTAADWPSDVNVVFNPGAVQLDGETILLARVEARTGISHIAVADPTTASVSGGSSASRS